MYKKIFKEIKKYKTIVIARHVGPDPDSLGSQYALKELINNTFNDKDIRIVGVRPNKFAYMGKNDKVDDIDKSKSLLIVTDTPDVRRIDGARPEDYESVVKIDHHPFVDNFNGIELSDSSKSSASEMILDLANNTPLKMNKKAAEFIFIGIVADTNRFMFDYTRSTTFKAVADMIEDQKLDINELYNTLYNRPFKELKFLAYLIDNLVITDNGLAYVKVTDKIFKKYDVDVSTPGNMIGKLNFIEGVKVWMIASDDKQNDNIRCSIRSKGPIVNKVAENYNGGGHMFASGARPRTWDIVDSLINDLDELCKQSDN